MKQDEEYHFYPNIYLSRLFLTEIIQMCLKIVWNWTASQDLLWLYLLIYFCKEGANGGWKFKTSKLEMTIWVQIFYSVAKFL